MKIILWGYPLEKRDTLSYVWYGFYKAFKALGHEVYWFDDAPQNFNFENSIFLCESYKCNHIPKIDSAKYFIHTFRPSVDKEKFDGLYTIDLAYNTDYQDHPINYKYILDRYKTERVAECCYWDRDEKRLYISWATDLLPNEINTDLNIVPYYNLVPYIGTIYGEGQYTNLPEVERVRQFCIDNKLSFSHIDPWINPVSIEENRSIIRQSYLAPDIRGQRDIKLGYIPCRILKNISYGQLGVTNSRPIHTLLEEKTIYHPDPYIMMEMAASERTNLKRIADQMSLIRAKHTFIERIKGMLKVI